MDQYAEEKRIEADEEEFKREQESESMTMNESTRAKEGSHYAQEDNSAQEDSYQEDTNGRVKFVENQFRGQYED